MWPNSLIIPVLIPFSLIEQIATTFALKAKKNNIFFLGKKQQIYALLVTSSTSISMFHTAFTQALS